LVGVWRGTRSRPASGTKRLLRGATPSP
jgi:hypothetical protein